MMISALALGIALSASPVPAQTIKAPAAAAAVSSVRMTLPTPAFQQLPLSRGVLPSAAPVLPAPSLPSAFVPSVVPPGGPTLTVANPEDAPAKVTEIGKAVEADLGALKDAEKLTGESASSTGERVLRVLTGEKGIDSPPAEVSVPGSLPEPGAIEAKLIPPSPTGDTRPEKTVAAPKPAAPTEAEPTWKDSLYRAAIVAAGAAGIISYLLALAWFMSLIFSPIINVPIDPSGLDPIGEMFR